MIVLSICTIYVALHQWVTKKFFCSHPKYGAVVPMLWVGFRRTPEIWSCGTHASGWVSGGHPRVEDGIVIRMNCFFWFGRECNVATPIHIKPCTGTNEPNYFVYRLPARMAPYGVWCQTAYCGSKYIYHHNHVNRIGLINK